MNEIETVLFGKSCKVRADWLKLFQRKEALVQEAMMVKNRARSMTSTEHVEEISRVVAKIISTNRKIAKLGAFVSYQYQ